MMTETELTVEQKKACCLRACDVMSSEWNKVCDEFNRLSAELEEECEKAKNRAQTGGCLIMVFEMIGISFLRAVGCPFGSVGNHLGAGKRASQEMEEIKENVRAWRSALLKGEVMIIELKQMINDAPAEKVEWWIYEALLTAIRKEGNFWENVFNTMRHIGVKSAGTELLMHNFDGGDSLIGIRIRRVLEGNA